MYISEKALKILEVLPNSPEFTTENKISLRLKMSPRSVSVYIKEVKGILGILGYKVISRPGIGICIDGDEKTKKEILEKLRDNGSLPAAGDHESRIGYIIKTLLRNKDYYTIQLLADDLYVSKRMIMKDLEEAEKFFEKFNLGLMKRPNLGLKVKGKEFDIRQALVAIISRLMERSRNDELSFTDEEKKENQKLDYRFDGFKYSVLNDTFKGIDVFAVQEILRRSEEMLGYSLTGESFVTMVVYLVILMDRMNFDKKIRSDFQQYPKIKDSIEYQVSVWIVRQLEQVMNIQIPAVEISFVTICLMGAEAQQFANDIEVSFDRLEPEYAKMAQESIKLIGNILSMDFGNDVVLLKGFALYLKKAVVRTKYHVAIQNPLFKEIKKNYSSIYCACWAINCILEKKAGIMFNEEEISFVALYFCGALIRQNSKLRAVLVCSDGPGTAQLIAGRIEREINEVKIINILSVRGMNESLPEDVDLVITTVDLHIERPNTVGVSEKLSNQDIEKIRGAVKKCLRSEHKDLETNLFLSKISEKVILLDGNFKTKEDIIRFGCRVMADKGFVTEQFCDDVLKKGKHYIHGHGKRGGHSAWNLWQRPGDRNLFHPA